MKIDDVAKAILAGRVLRLPVIVWIYETLQQDDDRRIAWEYFHEKLQSDFGDFAEKQLDIAIAWGRHAELFAYNDGAGELFFESDGGRNAEKSIALTELYEAWPVLPGRGRIDGFLQLQQDDAENFFLQLSARDKAELLFALPAGERRLWLRHLAADDALEVMRHAAEHERASLLSLLDDKARREIHGLIAYAEEKARGRINQRYARLRSDMTVDEAVSFLRRDARDRAQTIYYAYVTDAEDRLLGTVTFRDLLVAPGDKTIRDVMRTDVITAPEDTDRDSLRQLFARHNLHMIPLVDSERRIQRVVSPDDVSGAPG